MPKVYFYLMKIIYDKSIILLIYPLLKNGIYQQNQGNIKQKWR